MNDGATIDASEAGRSEPATSAYRMAGYCGSCGTWDTHGPACLSCGYDFTPDAANETLD